MDVSVQQSSLGRLREWLPKGDTLDAKAFMERHRTLSILLALHVPVLTVFGIIRGQGVLHSIGEVGFAALLLGLAQLGPMPRRVKGILVSAGLVWCSAVAVHFSGGTIEAHFHFFVILGFIALYQDWAAFGWAIVFTALSHGVGSMISPETMFNHEAAIRRPWTWALIHAGMVLFAATGQIIGWRHAETTQNRATELTTQLLREQAERQASYARIYVNLARRNQSLLHRQLAVIDELEQHEEDPETLRRLFALDHLTTRVRRNAESLLVVAGEDSPRRWSTAVSLADIARAAASEIEQYERTDVRVSDELSITGSAVVDITHLLAELIENAAEYSPPETTVVVSGTETEDGAVITIEDYGIGMSEADLVTANEVLAEPPELDEQQVRQLGFQVVGRLARKLGLRVRLRPTVGGAGPRAGAGRRGITAVVEIPAAVLSGDLPASGDPDGHAPTAGTPTPTIGADEQPLAEVTPLDSHLVDLAPDPPAAPASEPVGDVPGPAPAASPWAAASGGPPPPPPVASPPPVDEQPAGERLFDRPGTEPAVAPQVPAAPASPAAESPVDAPPSGTAFTPPPAVTIPGRSTPPEPALPPLPTGAESGSSMLFLAKQPPSSTPLFGRKGRKARREQPRQDAAAPAPQPSPAQQEPPPAPTAPPPPAVTSTTAPVGNGAQATNGGSTIDDLDQLAQYASRLPQRTPNASLAPGLRDPLPEGDDEPQPGSAPEARQALSAFQSAARSARRSSEQTTEHPS